MSEEAPTTSDSDDYRVTFYGILNAQGRFWTPMPFESDDAAREHIKRFWKHSLEKQDWALANYRIVPVRVQLTVCAPVPA